MRTDITFDAFRFDSNLEKNEPIVRADYLAYARFETTLSFTNQGVLDLVFERDGKIAVVPWIVLEGVMLLEHEESPFIWPSWMSWLDWDVCEGIEARVEPWLRSIVTARLENHAGERFFGASAEVRELIDYARSAGWLGATPAREVLRSIAPYRYAFRFAESARTLVRGPGAANGGAYLARRAGPLTAVLAHDDEVRYARKWFGTNIFTAMVPAGSAFDLYVGPEADAAHSQVRVIVDASSATSGVRIPIAEPLPPSIVVSYDLDDAPECGAFAVSVPATLGRLSAIVEPVFKGGSGGRIAMLVREDCMRGVDADTDAVTTLSAMLRSEGFEPEIVTPSHFDGRGFDLIHVFGLRQASAILTSLERSAAEGTPIAVTPYADDQRNERLLQASNVTMVASSSDETLRGEYLNALVHRVLRTDGPQEGPDTVSERRLLELARVAFVTCPREEAYLRSAYGFAGNAALVPAIASAIRGSEDVSAYVGTGDFALLRGPVHPQSNTYLIARAAAMAGLPLVVCGQVVDALSYQQMCAALGDLGVWLPAHGLSPGQQAALVSRARVVAEIGWSGRGLHYLASAAASRCSIVASANGYAADVWGDALVVADPASVPGMAAALRLAWDEAVARGERLAAKTAAHCDPFAMLVATATGYQAAASMAVSP